jgi:hypothetical protein
MNKYIFIKTTFIKLLLQDDGKFYFDCPDESIKIKKWLGYKIVKYDFLVPKEDRVFLYFSLDTKYGDGEYFMLGYFSMFYDEFDKEVLEFPDDDSAKLYFELADI